MKRNLLWLVATAMTLLLHTSCNRCANLDCISSSTHGQFRIVRNTDGKDLVFGPTALYDKNAIKFYALSGNDTSFYDYQAIRFSNANYDSIFYVNFFPEKNGPVFIRLSDTDTDTLKITYNTFRSKCCGIITQITNYKYNNVVDLPGNQGTQELRK